MIVRWSDPATGDIEGMYLYVAAHDLDAADRLYDRITRAANTLIQWPHAGRPGVVPGTRELVISGTSYLIIYKVNEDAVVIVRLMHGRQQWPQE